MTSIAKKIIVYSLVGILQLGVGAAVSEASPRHDDPQPRYQTEHRGAPDNRRQLENERHEREMQRRHNEEEREWRERQRQENERHDQLLQEIGAAALVYMLLSN